MSGDKLVYDLSNEIEGSPNVFVQKSWLNILDNQNQNYSSNQSVIDTSQLSNSNRWVSYREAYLNVPLLLTLANTANGATFLPNTAATSADYSIGLKNWFGTIIHSATLDMNGVTIIQQVPYINLWNSFKLITSLSWNDVAVMGATIGFYPDDPKAWGFYVNVANNGGALGGIPCASSFGQGTCNNSNFSASLPVGNVSAQFNSYNSGCGNIGFLKRQQYINYDLNATSAGLNGAAYSSLFPQQSCNNTWKSYISTKVNGAAAAEGVLQISVNATIYLKHIASFFQSIPLLKGIFFKLTLNLNSTTKNFQAITDAANANIPAYLTVSSVQNAVGGTNPLMICAAQGFSNGAATQNGSYNLALATAANTAQSYTANVSVGATCLSSTLTNIAGVGTGQLSKSIYLYVPAYTFNSVFEQAYLSSPIKSIKYTDVYQYQILNISPNQVVNQLLTNGIADLRSVCLIPFYSATATVGGNAAAVAGINPSTQLPVGMPCFQSPFDTAGGGTTSPFCLLGNFNIQVSGQNMIYNFQQRSFEEFNNQLYGVNSINSGMTDGLNSGFIDQLGFEMMYSYYYVNTSRMLPVEQSIPKSVQVIGQSYNANSIDIYAFLEYGASIDIDSLTGARC